MIEVHKLKGEVMWVNPDLISFVESAHGTRDTVLTLADGRHVIVADPADVVAERARRHRAEVLALAFELDRVAHGPGSEPAPDDDDGPVDGARRLRGLPTMDGER